MAKNKYWTKKRKKKWAKVLKIIGWTGLIGSFLAIVIIESIKSGLIG